MNPAPDWRFMVPFGVLPPFPLTMNALEQVGRELELQHSALNLQEFDGYQPNGTTMPG